METTQKRIDQHDIYKKLIKDYPWLWEAPAAAITDETYMKAMRMEGADWFPYTNYYKLEILNELKDKLFSFASFSFSGSFFLKAGFQLSKATLSNAIFVKHPFDHEDIVLYLDYYSKTPKEVIDSYNKFSEFEYKAKEEIKFGFKPL